MKKIKDLYLSSCQKLACCFTAPTEKTGRIMLFAAGLGLLTLSASDISYAQQLQVDADGRIALIIEAILEFIEGPFGALIMVIAGIGAIVSASFGQYRAALGLLVVAIGAFILRSLVRTFFPDSGVSA